MELSLKENELRNSNIELLRIILIAFVIILHFNNDSMGGGFSVVSKDSFEYILFHLFESFSISAVNCFMIVSGYFLYTNKKIRIVKILDVFFIVIFYRLFDYILKLLFVGEIFSLKHFVSLFLPANYFAIFYIVCYVFSPYIAYTVRALSIKKIDCLIYALFSIFIIITTLLDIAIDMNLFRDQGFLSPIASMGNGQGYTIVQFITMLCLGMWIRKTDFNPKLSILLIVYIGSSIIILILRKYITTYNYNFVFNTTAAMSLFCIFKKRLYYNKVINFIAKSCFSIFCIHTGGFANKIWRSFFITKEYFSYNFIFSLFWMFMCVMFMFTTCLIVSIIMRGSDCVKFSSQFRF